MTTTVNVYRAELARFRVDQWSGRTLKALLLDETSTYTFDPTDVYVHDVWSAGGVEGAWTSYARVSLSLSAATIDGSERWQCLAGTIDFGAIGASVGDETKGVVIYQHVTTDADHLLVAHVDVTPKVSVYDGATNFTVTVPGTGLLRLGA